MYGESIGRPVLYARLRSPSGVVTLFEKFDEHPVMDAVRVKIVRFVDDSYPGFVECQLFDVNAKGWLFHEKVPVVTLADLDSNSSYPQDRLIACEIVNRFIQPSGREVVCIDTRKPWDVESTTGDTVFEILAEQLTTIG